MKIAIQAVVALLGPVVFASGQDLANGSDGSLRGFDSQQQEHRALAAGCTADEDCTHPNSWCGMPYDDGCWTAYTCHEQCLGGGTEGDECRDDNDCEAQPFLWCGTDPMGYGYCNGGGTLNKACRTDDDCDSSLDLWCHEEVGLGSSKTCQGGGSTGDKCRNDDDCFATEHL